MKNRKRIALNKLFNFCVFFALFFLWFAIEELLDGEITWGCGIGAAAVLLLLSAILFTPCFYLFDDEGVTLRYLLLPNERYLWKDIRDIEVYFDFHSSKSAFVEVFFAVVFRLDAPVVGKKRFYMQGHIRKSIRTKRLLEMYWDGTIRGYLFEGLRERRAQRRAKRAGTVLQHTMDEIVALERESRAEARTWIPSFSAELRQYGLEIKTKYLYTVDGWEEYHSRPKKAYTYTLVAEIARPGETNEDRICEVDTDLLYVRLGKTAYRGVKNDTAREEWEATLTELLSEIRTNGFDSIIADDNLPNLE